MSSEIPILRTPREVVAATASYDGEPAEVRLQRQVLDGRLTLAARRFDIAVQYALLCAAGELTNHDSIGFAAGALAAMSFISGAIAYGGATIHADNLIRAGFARSFDEMMRLEPTLPGVE